MIKSLLFISMAVASMTFMSSTASAQITNYAVPPYATGFESGTLDNNWYTVSDNSNGRIQIWNSTSLIWSGDTAKAHTDSLWLGLDCNPGATYVTNEAWFGLNMQGQTNMRLQLWWAEWNDETEVQDGIFVSDNGGTTFTKIVDLDGAATTDLQWVYFDINLDSINTFHGLSFTSTYVIKLQQYDNYYFAGGNDGFLFDDINVFSTLSTNVNQYTQPEVKFFPNPTRGLTNVSLRNFEAQVNYTLRSIDGKEVASGITTSSAIQLDLTNYPQGLYFLQVMDDTHNETYKLIKH